MPNLQRFVATRRDDWTRLEHLIVQAERHGLAPLKLAGTRELTCLYRACARDLAQLRSEPDHAGLGEYVNDLVARGYGVLEAPAANRETAAWRFWVTGFPRLFRREWRSIALAFSVMLCGALTGAAFVAVDPSALGALIPDGHQEHTPRERVSREENAGSARDGRGDGSVAFSGWLFTHNLEVACLVFALGLSFGVGTLALLFYNGIPIGALAMQYHAGGLDLFYWAWILPHGVIELTALSIAGGAGLVIARGLLLPGRERRRDALAREAKTAVLLLSGCIPMLLLAGVIEGSVSQLHAPVLPYAAKLGFAALMALCSYGFLLTAGRHGPAADGGRADA